MIPLYRGWPRIKNKSFGPKGKWFIRKSKTKTVIHINKQAIANNHKPNKEKVPTICVKQSSSRKKTNTYVNHVKILGTSEVIYRPEKPLDCGAVAWIQTESEVVIIGERLTPKKALGIMRKKS